MKNLNNTVKNENPAMNVVDYSTHTQHFKKATPYTYNYAFIDGVLMEMYDQYTIRQTASILNEPFNRVVYRVQFLQKNHSKHHTFAGHAIVAQQEFPKLEVSALSLIHI